MLAVGMLIIWGGYGLSLWGWCLLRGYDVTLGQLMSPVHPYGQGKGQSWPPGLIPDSQVFPSGSPGGAGAAGALGNLGAGIGAGAINAARILQQQTKTGTSQQPGTTTAGGRG